MFMNESFNQFLLISGVLILLVVVAWMVSRVTKIGHSADELYEVKRRPSLSFSSIWTWLGMVCFCIVAGLILHNLIFIWAALMIGLAYLVIERLKLIWIILSAMFRSLKKNKPKEPNSE